MADVLIDEWRLVRERHGWAVGRYVIMPEHVHFFCAAEIDACPLPDFMRAWKQWTSKRVARQVKVVRGGRDQRSRLQLWQREFFDHVLRSSESYSEKWDYVRNNPVRAGLVADADDWPWQGTIEELRM